MNSSARIWCSDATATNDELSLRQPSKTVEIVATKELRMVKSVKNKAVETAVYAHIRAIRALGRTAVDTSEIARALGIPEREVRSTLTRLKDKGVKVVA